MADLYDIRDYREPEEDPPITEVACLYCAWRGHMVIEPDEILRDIYCPGAACGQLGGIILTGQPDEE